MQVQDLRKALEHQRKELYDCRAEIAALKMHIEVSRSLQNLVATDVDVVQSQPFEKYKEEIKVLQMEIERLKEKSTNAPDSVVSAYSESMQTEEKVVEVDENKTVISHPISLVKSEEAQSFATRSFDDNNIKLTKDVLRESMTNPSYENNALANIQSIPKQNDEPPPEDSGLNLKSGSLSSEADKAASTFSILRISYSVILFLSFFFVW